MSASGATATPDHRPRTDDPRSRARELVERVAAAFIAALHEVGGTDPKAGRMGSADLTLAMRHVEDAESRAIRHIKRGHRA